MLLLAGSKFFIFDHADSENMLYLTDTKKVGARFSKLGYIWLELEYKATQEVLKIIGTPGESIPLVFKPRKSNCNYYEKQNFLSNRKSQKKWENRMMHSRDTEHAPLQAIKLVLYQDVLTDV